MSLAEVWSRVGFDPFKTITRFSNRPDQQQLALVMLGTNQHSLLTHEITLTVKPGSKQTISKLLHRLKAHCREEAEQSLSFVGIESNFPLPHGHFYARLIERTPLYEAVMGFMAKHAGLDNGKVWFPKAELQLGLMQKLNESKHHLATGLPGAYGKIGYALEHYGNKDVIEVVDGIEVVTGVVTPKVKILASNDYRALGRRMSKHGFDAPLAPMIDTETMPAAPPILLELKTPAKTISPSLPTLVSHVVPKVDSIVELETMPAVPSRFPSLVLGVGVRRRARGWDPVLDRADDDAEMVQRLASASSSGFPPLTRQQTASAPQAGR